MGAQAIRVCFLIIGVTISRTFALPSNLLYFDEQSAGVTLPNGDEISSEEIDLIVPIVFYGQSFSTIFVNSNGLLSFTTEIPNFFNIEFPLDYPIIAPLYSNIDTTISGTITYQETQNRNLLQRANANIHDAFAYSQEFIGKSLFIVTWTDVGYHGSKSNNNKLNTFQVVICSDGEDSYVEFLYPDDGIQWIQGAGNEHGLPDARAQVGFVSPDGRYFTVRGSGTDQIQNLNVWTNRESPGEWIFRVGRVQDEGNIEQPDIINDALEEPVTTCAQGSSFCHSKAKCQDYSEGFCCVCKKGYYGNGKLCVHTDAPLRINGKVSGKVNGEMFSNLDLQSYVVMSDARAYTAVSKVPESIGYDSQTLQILCATIGWLFAKPVNNAINGYQLTGGLFNQTAIIKFPSTNDTVTVRQKYTGLDVFDQGRLEADIQGSIPTIPDGVELVINEYEEQYTMTKPGVIHSSSTREYRYLTNSGSTQEIVDSFTIDQTILFESCVYGPLPIGETWRLKVGKNFINYEAKEQIIRFGLSNKVLPLGDIDPCKEGRETCGQDSSCVVDGDSFRCVCNPGYQYLYHNATTQPQCEDINECATGSHECDYNAQCHNEIGSYRCICNPGFEGDGRFCQNAVTCDSVQCNENAECVVDGYARCKCIAGFTGNGQHCIPVKDQSCHIANNCSPHAMCTIEPSRNQYQCQCLPGFIGNGFDCQKQPEERQPERDWVEETCFMDKCWCPEDYEKVPNTRYCQLSQITDETTPYSDNETYDVSCDVLNNCHRHAQCMLVANSGRFECQCKEGYEGNGIECTESEVSCFDSDTCDLYANCVYNETLGRSLCVCNEGYKGNGRTCTVKEACNQDEDCPENQVCKEDYINQRFRCDCKEDFIMDIENQCIRVVGTCGGGTCVENAECLFDDDYQTHYCQCLKDFVGDGITECKPTPISCNVRNDCDLDAQCLYEHETGEYKCKCEEGFVGDGYTCTRERTCLYFPEICDQNAKCIKNNQRKDVCECAFGYTGNGTFCAPNPKHEGNFLLLNQGMATLRIPFQPSPRDRGRPIQIKYQQMPIGLAVDCLGGKVYWSDIIGKAIRFAAYNGSSTKEFLTAAIGSPEGLAVDWVSRNIYWTDSTKDTIEVANVETLLRRTLFNTSLVNPRGIAVHPQRGKLFWSDWNRKSPKIEWSDSDGSERDIFLSGEDVQLPNSLAIDWDTDELCYADAGTHKIECVHIDSRSKRTVATNCTYPFGLAISDQHYYWSDWNSKKIERVEKETMKKVDPLIIPFGGADNPYGLAAVPDKCPHLVNLCQSHRDQCPEGYLCLPTSTGSRKCVCGIEGNSPIQETTCKDNARH